MQRSPCQDGAVSSGGRCRALAPRSGRGRHLDKYRQWPRVVAVDPWQSTCASYPMPTTTAIVRPSSNAAAPLPGTTVALTSNPRESSPSGV